MGSGRIKVGTRLAQAAEAECVELQRLLQRARRGNDRALHLARKSLQRLRAMLRLLQPLDPALVKRENRRLRRLRRRLAPLRDAVVCAHTFRQLAARGKWKGFASRLEELAAIEADRHRAQWRAHGAEHPLWREAQHECRLLQRRIRQWPLASLQRKHLDRAQARARKRLRRQLVLTRGTHGRTPRHLLRRRLRQAAVVDSVIAAADGVDAAASGKLLALAKGLGVEGDLWLVTRRVRQAIRVDASLRPLARALDHAQRDLCTRNDRKLRRAGQGG